LKHLIIFLFFLELLVAEPIYLKGRVVNMSGYGQKGLKIKIPYTSTMYDTTIKNGHFRLKLDDSYYVGKRIILVVDDPNWLILPSNGQFVIPENYYLDVQVRQNNQYSTIDKSKPNKKVKSCIQISAFKSLLLAEKEKERFENKWKKKYKVYIDTVNGVHKVLLTISPYSEVNIKKLYQKIIRVPRYKKSESFIRKNCE